MPDYRSVVGNPNCGFLPAGQPVWRHHAGNTFSAWMSSLGTYRAIHERAFSRLPGPALRCSAAPCPGPRHVYTAINLGLNAVASFGHPRIRLLPYIFKVGSTLSCGGRRVSEGGKPSRRSASVLRAAGPADAFWSATEP